MALTHTTATPGTALGSPIRTGDAAIDTNGGTGYFEFPDTEMAFLDDWNGDFGLVVCGTADGNPGWFFGMRANGGADDTNKIELRQRTGVGDRVEVVYRRNSSAKELAVPNSDFGNHAGSRPRYLVWTEGASSGGTFHLAYLKEDGTLFKDSIALDSGNNSLEEIFNANANAGHAFVGGRSSSDVDDCDVFCITAVHTPTNHLGNLTDDEIIEILRDPTMIGIHPEVEAVACFLGDAVDATTEERVNNRTITNLTSSYKLKCPHTGMTSNAFNVSSGTPKLLPQYAVSTKGQTLASQEVGKRLTPSIANSSVMHEAINAEDFGNELHFYRSLVDADTKQRLKMPIPFDPVAYNGTTERLGWANSPRDTHNGIGFWEMDGRLVAHHSGHDADSGGYYDVFQIVTDQDGGGMQEHIRYDFGGAALAEIGFSYVQGIVKNDKLYLDVRSSLSLQRRSRIVEYDPSDDSFQHKFITTTPALSGDDWKVFLGNGAFDLGGDEILFTQLMLTEDDTHGGLGGLIVDTSDITANASYRLAGSGEVCDGAGGRPTVGSIDPGDEGFFIDSTARDVAYASADEVTVCPPAFKNNKLIAMRAISSGTLDALGSRDFTAWYLTTWAYDGTKFTEESDRDITSIVTAAAAENDIDQLVLHHAAGVVVPSGKAGVIVTLCEPNGTTMNTSTNCQSSTTRWGTLVRFLTVPSLTDLSTAAFSATTYDLETNGGLSGRSASIDGQGAAGGTIVAEKIYSKPDGTSVSGHGYPEPIDVSSVIDELPASSRGFLAASSLVISALAWRRYREGQRQNQGN